MENGHFDALVETLGSEAFAQMQLRKFQLMLAPVLVSNTFYRGKLGGVGITHGTASYTTTTTSVHCPFTTKSELSADQLANPPDGTNLTVPAGAVRSHPPDVGDNRRASPMPRHGGVLELVGAVLELRCTTPLGVTPCRPDLLCLLVRAVHRILERLRGRPADRGAGHPGRGHVVVPTAEGHRRQ